MTGGRSAHLVPEEKMVLKVQRVEVVPMVILVPWGPLGKRESLACPDYRGTQEDKGQRVPLDSLASRAPTERRVAGGHLESQDHGDREAQRARGVNEAHEASRGSLALRATPEVMAQLALLVNGDPTDPKVPPAFLDPRVPRAHQARTDSLDTLGREGRPVSKARLALQGPQEWLALRVPQERRAPWVSVAILVLQALLVNRASQVLLGKKERRVTQVLLASLGRMALQDCVDSLGTEGYLAPWEPLDSKAVKAPLAHQVLRVLQGREDQLVPLGPSEFQGDLGLRDLRGLLERKDFLARKVHKAQLAEMASKVPWGSLDQPAQWVLLEKMEIRERSESQGRREARATKASRVLLGLPVLKARLDSQALREQMVNLALVDSRACLGRKEMKVQEVSQDPPGQWDCRVCQDLQEKRARQETWARWALLVHQAPEDPLELQVPMDHRVLLEGLATLVQSEKRENLVKLEILAFQEKEVPWDLKEKEGRRERLAPLVLLDPLDPKALLEMMAPKAALALWAFLEILVPLESQAPQVKTAHLVTKGTMVNLGRRGPRALLVNLVHLGLQERGVPQALQALKAGRGRKEPREKLA